MTGASADEISTIAMSDAVPAGTAPEAPDSSPDALQEVSMGSPEQAPRARPPPMNQLSSTLPTPEKKSGIAGASFNLMNSIVGAGIVGIPFALSQTGLIAGLFLLILVAWLTDKSLQIIVNLASYHPQLRGKNVCTFEDLASFPFGKAGYKFILLNMFVSKCAAAYKRILYVGPTMSMAYGAMVAYLLIIKDTVPTVFGFGAADGGGFERELILIGTSLVIIVPLAAQRDMASLAFTSLLSICADIILVGFIVTFSPVVERVSDEGGFVEVLKNDAINPTLFIGLGILSTAMACQHSAFIVSGSLENKTQKRWSIVTFRSIFLAAFLCALFGVFGYLGFLEDTKGDVLNNFEAGSLAANGARVLLAITMFLTYPMESFVARHVVVQLMHDGDLDGDDSESESTDMPKTKTGSLGGSCIAYFGPGMVYMGVNGESFLLFASELLTKWQRKVRNDSAEEDKNAIELPVAGDSNQVISSNVNLPADFSDVPIEGSKRTMVSALPEGGRPLWWYLGLFPLWCSIASHGRQNMRENLSSNDGYQAHVSPSSNEESEMTEEEVLLVPSAAAGLGTNIYVQINNIFYTPA
eukprot:scaffold168886_cov50-Attheya_sp.AAC.2